MLRRRITVRPHERILLVQDGRFGGLLLPGEHRVLVSSYESLETEKHNLNDLVFESVWSDYLLRCRPEIIDRHFTLVQTRRTQIAMVYVNGQLYTVLVPAKRLLFWREAALVTAEVVDVVVEDESPVESHMARC